MLDEWKQSHIQKYKIKKKLQRDFENMVLGRQEVNMDNDSQLDFYPQEIIKTI